MKMIDFPLKSLFLIVVFLPTLVCGSILDQQRNDFLLAEKLLNENKETEYLILSNTLKSYPLYPYLEYQRLKDHPERTGEILQFLNTYGSTRYADPLQSRWLHHLAKNERWLDFLNYYRPTDNAALRCEYYWAHYKTGHESEALNEAKNLWLLAKPQPSECEPLLTALTLSPLLTNDLLWHRFEEALAGNQVAIAEAARHFMPASDRVIADIWLHVHRQPVYITEPSFRTPITARHGRIFAHGVERLAKDNVDSALLLWEAGKPIFTIDSKAVQRVERCLGIQLALRKDLRAFAHLSQVPASDTEVREWKIRAALLEQNWRHVADSMAELPPEELQQPKWQYWQARTLAATGKDPAGAQSLFAKVAEDRSLYGILAANILNKTYTFANKPVAFTTADMINLANEPDIQAVAEWIKLQRKPDALKQWWFAVNKMPKDKCKLAAKLAQQWQWLQTAIMTLVKADYWDDLELRFPIVFLTDVQFNANLQHVDPALILGLMRQESMLNESAVSAVGARGLMQLMPKTARQIAGELHEKLYSNYALHEPAINIRYGSYYLKKLLTRFNGHLALATAAYNAGPGRVLQWLPPNGQVAADIWIETIPYKETRKYVASVISYAAIYQSLIYGNLLKAENFLPDISAG
jgi:soluble lytic murein transglycosylase